MVLNIQNLSGHKFPSGIPARRCWVHVTVKDGRGRLVFESGKPQPDGSISGNNADMDPTTYEPHHDHITAPDQVQIYEPIMLDSDRAVTYTLLRAASYAKDNRLLPAGFDKTSALQDIAVWGEATNDANFTAGEDQVTYQVNVSGKRKPLMMTAELLYQPVSYSFAENVRQEALILQIAFWDSLTRQPKHLR